MRDRIVVGLMLTNAVYSSANAIPMQALLTGITTCGQLMMSFYAIRFGRAWWFFGKYGMVSFELFIVGASIWALRKGTSAVPPWAELIMHTMCWAAAISAFSAFYFICANINANGYNSETLTVASTGIIGHISETDDHDDDQTVEDTARFERGRDSYDNLVREMLVVWDVAVGVAVLLWIVLRLLYRWMQSCLRVQGDAAMHARAEDVWAATRRSAWESQLRLMEARSNAFAEIANPLEPYIGVFVIFAIPAVLMSTPYCQNNSGIRDGTLTHASRVDHVFTFGTCDVWCEFVLAFRSLGTVAVYLIPRQRRVELVSVRNTLGKLCARMRRCVSASFRWHSSYMRLVNVDDEHSLVELSHHHVEQSPDHELGASFQIDECNITKEHVLGDGTFGEVWSGVLQPGDRPVAIKVLHMTMDDDGDSMNPDTFNEFKKECEALRQVDSPHLVKFYGCGVCQDGQLFIVTELMSLGSLEGVLHDTNFDISWQTRTSIGLQIALGMEHLHKRGMMHRDLKSANVVLDTSLKAKVCDFGLARKMARPSGAVHVMHSPFTGTTLVLPAVDGVDSLFKKSTLRMPISISDMAVSFEDSHGTVTRAAGTLQWMAPEIFRGDTHYGRAVDVYSFGMVLWELTTRKIPWSELYDGTIKSSHVTFFDKLNTALQTGMRPALPSDAVIKSPQFVEVMVRCWSGDAADRPPFSEIAAELAQCCVLCSTV